MRLSVQIIFVLFWTAQDLTSCNSEPTMLSVKFMEPLTLNCTYNCSTAFVRGCWSGGGIKKRCPVGTPGKSGFCTVSLHLPNVSTEHLEELIVCYTERTDDPDLPQKTQHTFSIHIAVQTTTPYLTSGFRTETRNESFHVQENETGEGESTGIQVLATVSVFVAMILAALAVYLCVNRHHWNYKGEPLRPRPGSPQRKDVPTPVIGSPSAQSERVTLRIPPRDDEEDTEVPYADIMITVRGVSTPELTQVNCTAAGDHKEWWGDDPRSHLQASRSADRLHVPQPTEVSRKMSTNSEYAIITYA